VRRVFGPPRQYLRNDIDSQDYLMMISTLVHLRIACHFAARSLVAVGLIFMVALPFAEKSATAADPSTAAEPDVRGQLRKIIDIEIKAGWGKEQLTHPGRSTDSVFLRRVYLDLVGMIPTYEETVAFLKDTDSKKREKLIDNLLADPRFSRNQATVWDVVLLGRNPQGIQEKQRDGFRKWLLTQFEKNEPYDQIVRKLLTAEEENSQLFYAQFRGSADDTATAVTRYFLGTQIQCAKCHDHPFDSWTQKDYHGMVGFFVRTMVVEAGTPQEKTFKVGEKSAGEVLFMLDEKDPKTGKFVSVPIKPKFLSGEELKEPELSKDFVEPKLKPNELPPKPAFSRRTKIVEWITAKENPYFAKAVANRVWAQFMGRGFVHPVDDFNQQNEPSHSALLKAIEAGLVANKFDLKWLVREIVNSEAYQSTDVGPAKDALPKYYERARVRPLNVEELMASLHVATGLGINSALKSVPSRDMLKYLGEPNDGQGTFQGSLTEHLFLHNGDVFRGLCRPIKDNLPDRLLKGTDPWEAKVDRMFLSLLSRSPTSAERERFVAYLAVPASDAKLASQRLEEAIWVLVSCSEFRFNR